MPTPVTFHRKSTTPEATPGAISFVQHPSGQSVRGFVAGNNGVPLPLLGPAENMIFLDPGETIPNPPAPSTLYVSLSTKTLYFVGADGAVMVLPIHEGSILSKLYYANAASPVSSTGRTPTTMLTMTETFTSGIYAIDIAYGWTCDSTGDDFIMEALVDGSLYGQPHQQEPQDSAGSVAWTNTNQLQTGFKRLIVDFTDGAQHTIDVTFRCSRNNVAVSMFDTSILAWNLTGIAAL